MRKEIDRKQFRQSKKERSRYKGRTENALAPEAEEGRNKLRKASGRRK